MKPTDHNLRDALKALPVPPASPAARSDTLRQAREAWRDSLAPAPPIAARAARRPRIGLLLASCGAGLACALALVGLWIGRGQPVPEAPGHLLAEMEKLFPGQVLAVVRQDQTVDLQLGDDPSPVPTDQALRIELVRGSQRVEVLTYSGRSVSVKFDGRLTRLMPLLTESGKWIFVTDDQVLVPGGQLAGYQISAQLLAAPKV